MSTILTANHPGRNGADSGENLTISTAKRTFQSIVERLSGETANTNARMAAILYGALCTKDKYRLKNDDIKIYTAAIAISAIVQAFDEVAEKLVYNNGRTVGDERSTFDTLMHNIPAALDKDGIPPIVTAAICEGSNIAFFRDMYDAMLLENQHFDPKVPFATYLETVTSSNGLHVVSRVLYLLFGEEPPRNYILCGPKGAVRLTNESLRICMDIIKRKNDIADGSPNVVAKYMQQYGVSEAAARKQLQQRSDENIAEASVQADKSGDPVLTYVISLAKMVSTIAKTGLTL